MSHSLAEHSRDCSKTSPQTDFCPEFNFPVNGFSQIGEADSAVYYDLPQYRPFWQQSSSSMCRSIFIIPARP
jgi:hypothetical protein